MKKRLTDRLLQSVTPPVSGRDTYTDADGLELRVSPPDKRGGVLKSWSIRYHPKGGKRRRTSYGSYPKIPLAEARARAKEVAAAAARGIDLPAAEEREREEQRKGAKRPQTFGDLLDRYVEQHCRPTQRKWETVERLYQRHVPSRLRETPPSELRRGDLVELLDELQNKKKLKAQVNRVREHLIAALNWGVDHEYLDVNPFAGVKRRRLEAPRTRVLTDDELRAIWRAAEKRPGVGSVFVKVLFLVGQRRDEVRLMAWSEVDFARALWTIPSDRNKAKREHEVPLSPAMVELLGHARAGGPVFTLNGKKPYAGHQLLKAFLDRESGVAGWTYHDIRRTVASGLAALQVPQDTIDRVLNHSKGTLAGTYNRHRYLDEKRRALEAWADHLAFILGKAHDGANVVELCAGS